MGPTYIEEKLERKQNIDEEIRQADRLLQSKNVYIETINNHMKLRNSKSMDYLVTSLHDADTV